jgi:hypothetical protein
MSLTDEEFREEYKPLQVPAHYAEAITQKQKVIFALAQIGSGTAGDVIVQLEKLEAGKLDNHLKTATKHILVSLFEQGHITGGDHDGGLHFNLSKITSENSGSVDPQNLAAGLD